MENNQTNDTNKKPLPKWSYYFLGAGIILVVVIAVLFILLREEPIVTATEKNFGETFNLCGLDLTVDNFSLESGDDKACVKFQVTIHNPTSKTIKFTTISSGLYYMLGDEPARYNSVWTSDFSQWEFIPYDTQTGAFRFYVPQTLIPNFSQMRHTTFTESKNLGFEFRLQENKQDAMEYFFVKI